MENNNTRIKDFNLQLTLQWHLTNSTIACGAGRTLVVICDLCRPDGSHVWVGRTAVVTWRWPGTKLYSVLAHVRYAPQGHQLKATCYFLPDVCKTDTIWGHRYLWSEYLLGSTISIHVQSWPIWISPPALDRRPLVVPLVLWLCSFQPWCSVETISFYLLLRIDRQWMCSGIQVMLLPCLFLALSRSALPAPYLKPWPSRCVCRACHRRQQPELGRLYLGWRRLAVGMRLLLIWSSMCQLPRGYLSQTACSGCF